MPRGAKRRARRGGTARHHPLAPSRVSESGRRKDGTADHHRRHRGRRKTSGDETKSRRPWPKDLPSQIAAVRDLISSDSTESWTLDRTAKSFKGAKRTQVQSVLD